MSLLISQLHQQLVSGFSNFFVLIYKQDGSKAPFKGNPCSSADALLKANKNPRGPSKRTMWDHEELPATNIEILKLLYDLISQFLTGGYNGKNYLYFLILMKLNMYFLSSISYNAAGV